MPHVVFDEDLNHIEQQVAEIKNVLSEMLKTLTMELSNIENMIKQIHDEEEQRKPRVKSKNRGLL
jgi:hypothetical protein